MDNYYDCGGGGCFAGYCIVNLANGTTKQVADLKKGDIIRNKDNTTHKIENVIKILNPSTLMSLVELEGGLVITPKHPIILNGKWVKPRDIA